MWFSRPVDPEEAAELLDSADGVTRWADRTPTPLDSAGIGSLSSQQRDKVRRIVDGIVENITDLDSGDAKLLEESGGNGHGGNGTSRFVPPG